MEDTRDREIGRLAAAQHGLFTAEQAEEVGFRSDHREFRVRIGRWEIVHRGVYRMAGVAESTRSRMLAACWAAHSLAVVSHRSAALLWELPGGRNDVVEITCRRWRRARPGNLVVHETKLLLPDDITEVDGVPATAVEQTLLGLAAVLSPAVVEMAMDQALRRRLTTRRRLDAFMVRKGKRGRNGAGVMRELLDAHDPLAGLPESAMETKLKRLLRRHNFPAPVFQYVIRVGGRFIARVDAAYPDLRIAIEFDSYAHHTGKLALIRDNDRRNQLASIGWLTVSFTAADLERDGGQAIDALRAARHQRTHPRSGVTAPR